jgi:lysylphosphatidylglycerol synthetase-like protein (DUF2156 family)
MRPLALALALAYLVENVVAGYLLFFFATFPFENTAEDRSNQDWPLAVGAVLVLLAMVTLIAVIVKRRGWAAVTFAANAVLALALLSWPLGQSDHSDGKLVAWTLAIELTGLSAIALSNRQLTRATRLSG